MPDLRTRAGDTPLTDAAVALLGRHGTRVRVKVCCIASPDEAELAIAAGADALGLVSAMPSGPGPIPEREIASVVRQVAGRRATVLLTSQQDAPGIAGQLERLHPDVVQLVDALDERALVALRAVAQGTALMQVIHVRDASSVAEAVRLAPLVDAILLDSGNPLAPVKELGGTGRVHDWRVSAAIRDAVPVPVFLAGGLRPDNVAEAIAAVEPFGVDVCSGVRAGGRLDGEAVRAFVTSVRAAERGLAVRRPHPRA